MPEIKPTRDTYARKALRVIFITAIALIMGMLFLSNSSKASMNPVLPSAIQQNNLRMLSALHLSEKAKSNLETRVEKKEYVVYHLVFVDPKDGRIYQMDSFEDENDCFVAAKSEPYKDFVFEQFGVEDPKLICQASKRKADN